MNDFSSLTKVFTKFQLIIKSNYIYMKTRTIIEPFKIKSVEPIRFTTKEEREKILKSLD